MSAPSTSRLAPLALLLLLSAAPLSAATLQLDKLVTFTTAEQVRIDARLKADGPLEGVELAGALTREPGGQMLWQGVLCQTNLAANTALALSQTVKGLKPELWGPSSPALYRLKLSARQAGKLLAEGSVRLGFRSFESRNSQFYLNGQPIFLRGIAINPPGRTIPEAVGESRAFALDYVRFLKSHNVNTIRMTHDSQAWFDVCDELGMLVYQGQYASPLEGAPRKQGAPIDSAKSIAAYQQLFETYACHPSILIYILANELPVSGNRGKAFHDFLSTAHAALKAWDSTRLYIGNAGYGEGREGDVCDVHRYWGWYYNSFLTYYNLRDSLADKPLFGDLSKQQPLTFTECVGCFTGPSGEINLVRSKQLAPQLGWTGHASNQREEALGYQAFMVKQATESFRRLRPLSPRLSGLMPFSIFFFNWEGIESFAQMQPKPAMEQLAISYQPVLLSWELWTPQVHAGAALRPIAHIINDAENGSALSNATLLYGVRAKDGRELCQGHLALPPIPYYGTWSQALHLELPADLATGEYVVFGKVQAGATQLSHNSAELFVGGPEWKSPARPLEGLVGLYEPAGKTAAALEKLGLKFERLTSLSSWPTQLSVLVLGEECWDSTLSKAKAQLQRFVRQGGRIVCLKPEPKSFETDWLPEPVEFLSGSANDTDYPPRTRPFAEQMNVNPERPNHPVFAGLERARLAMWSDYTGWEQSRPGFPRLYPVSAGFKLLHQKSLANTAILADYDRGLEGVALCELFEGQGSVLLTGFDLVKRVGLDPVAERLLLNLVTYAASKAPHEVYPLIEQPIRWGNYATEQGLVCGNLNGLLVNAEWLQPPTAPAATPLAPNTGAWNVMPGDQFAPCGRSPAGPYGYSTASSLKSLRSEEGPGDGAFWARIPPGKETMVTRLKNPEKKSAQWSIALNEQAGAPLSVGAGQQLEVRSALPANCTRLAVRFSGPKSLVLLETRFE